MRQDELYRYLAPVDPECPEVAAFYEGFYGDPMTRASGVADEISHNWDRKHQAKCERCMEYRCANIEVVGP